MKYRIKIVEYPSGLIEYYPQYRSFFTQYNFVETKLMPLANSRFCGYKDTFKYEIDVCRNSLEQAKDFLRKQNVKITYDYNWNQW